LTRYIADIEFLRRHFGHERWLVAGHSWGAGLVLRYALAHPGFAINFECNTALNDEEKQTIEDDILDRCRALDIPVRVVHGDCDPRPVWAVEPLVAGLTRWS
jgi:dienelactone hydrolase